MRLLILAFLFPAIACSQTLKLRLAPELNGFGNALGRIAIIVIWLPNPFIDLPIFEEVA